MIHDRAEIARFLAGEKRFIAAAWKRDARESFFVLPDGEAELHRAMARAELRCFVPNCPTPAVTTVNRGARFRDGFRHQVGGDSTHGYGREGINHIMGKTVIAEWLRSQPGIVDVQLEQGVDNQRRRSARVADVLAVDASGARFAFEIQYAAISQGQWKARTDDYAEAGIGVCWLWGHVGTHLQARRSPDRTRATVVTRGVSEEAGCKANSSPTMWLNPIEGAIAIPVTKRRDLMTPLRAGHGELLILPLREMELRGGMPWHPRFAELAANERAADQADREEAERWQQKQREEQQRREEAAARAAAERRERMLRARAARAADTKSWGRSRAATPFQPARSLRCGFCGGLSGPAVRYGGSADHTMCARMGRPGPLTDGYFCWICTEHIPAELSAAGWTIHPECRFADPGPDPAAPKPREKPTLFDDDL